MHRWAVAFRLAWSVGLCLFSVNALAERYLTWIDENGQVRRTLQRETPEPSPVVPDTGGASETASGTTSEAAGAPVVETTRTHGSERPVAEPVNPEIPDPMVQRILGDPQSPSRAPVATGANEIDESDYMDAEELARRGFVRDGDQRFYTWTDSDGTVRSSPIGQSQEAVVVYEPLREQFRVVANEQRRQALPLPLAGQADPVAIQMLGLDKPVAAKRDIDVLADRCCQVLAEGEIDELQWADDLYIELTGEEDSVDFGVGLSRYRLVELPKDYSGDVLFRLKAIISRGMFMPAVAILDEQWVPQRLLTDILYVYEPDNWFRHAYLEGFFRVQPGPEQRYLLIFSRAQDQRQTTVVDGVDEEPLLFPHKPTGSLYLARVFEN